MILDWLALFLFIVVGSRIVLPPFFGLTLTSRGARLVGLAISVFGLGFFLIMVFRRPTSLTVSLLLLAGLVFLKITREIEPSRLFRFSLLFLSVMVFLVLLKFWWLAEVAADLALAFLISGFLGSLFRRFYE